MIENAKMLRTPSSWAKAIALALEEYGVDVPSIFDKVSMDYSLLDDKDAYYWQDSITQLWELALKETGDDSFGVKAGLNVHAGSYPALAYSLIACKDLKSSLDRLFRFQRMLAEGFEFEFKLDGDRYALSFNIRPSSRPASGQAIDAAISSFLNFLDWATQGKIRAQSAQLARPSPSDTQYFDDIFKCPIEYQAGVNKIYFSKEDLSFPLPTANEEISKIHDANANRLLENIDRGEITRQVRDLIIEILPSGEPKLEQLSIQLGLSPSTLKRRLSSEKTSFKSLLEEIREQLATNYLTAKHYSISEISYLLGFSETSAFNRAFKRWKGMAPTKWLKSKETN